MPDLANVEIIDVIRRTHNVKSLRFADRHNAAFKAGQFLMVSFDGSKEMSRYLSISNSPTEKGYLEVTKKITGSAFSSAIDSTKPGDRMKISRPMGLFFYKDEYRNLGFLSGGIGITPVRSIAKYLTDTKPEVNMALLYANREARDIVFKDDLDKMAEVNPNFQVVHVLCDHPGQLSCRMGRINAACVREEVRDYMERFFLICGPPGMVQTMQTLLSSELGLPAARIVTESFAGYGEKEVP